MKRKTFKGKKVGRSYKKKSKILSGFGSAGGGYIPRSIVRRSGLGGGIKKVSRSLTTNLSTTAGADLFGALVFKLSDLPQYSDFTNGYDQYRIVAVKLEFIPLYKFVNYWNSTTGTLNYIAQPMLVTSVDTTDATTPTENDLFAMDTVKTHGAFTPEVSKYVRWVKPEIAVATYQGAFSGYMAIQNGWCETSTPDTQYYGCKYGLMRNPSFSINFNISATYYIELRQPK